MKTHFEDLASAIVSATFCVATAAALYVMFVGAALA